MQSVLPLKLPNWAARPNPMGQTAKMGWVGPTQLTTGLCFL